MIYVFINHPRPLLPRLNPTPRRGDVGLFSKENQSVAPLLCQGRCGCKEGQRVVNMLNIIMIYNILDDINAKIETVSISLIDQVSGEVSNPLAANLIHYLL
jgi:hypothetical protein